MKRRAFGVGSALLVSLLVLTLALGMANLCTTHLQILGSLRANSHSLDLARSVLAGAAERVLRDPGFGSSGQAGCSFHLGPPDWSEGEAWLSFDRAQARKWGIAASTNNLLGSSSVLGELNQVVPRQAVHLVAQAKAGGKLKTLEAIYFLPPFPFAVTAEGFVHASGQVTVGSLENGSEDLSLLQPSSLLSNASGSEAILLGPGAQVLGDVRAVGQIAADGADIRGRVLPNQEPRPLDHFRLQDFDPVMKDLAYIEVPQTTRGDLRLSGALRGQGSTRIKGDLTLNSALLYVDGDLVVEGNLEGQGAVVATGRVEIARQTQFSSDDGLALLAHGSLKLHGQDREMAQIRGMVYTEEGIDANQICLRGTTIAAQNGATAPGVTLHDTTVIETPALEKITFTVNQPGLSQPFYVPIGRGLLCVNGQWGMYSQWPWKKNKLVIDWDNMFPAQSSKTAMNYVAVYPGPNYTANLNYIKNGVSVGKNAVKATSASDLNQQITAAVTALVLAEKNKNPTVAGIQLNDTFMNNYTVTPPTEPVIQPSKSKTESATFEFDPSKLIPPWQRAKLLVWREH